VVCIVLSSSQGDKKFLDRGGDGGHTIVYSVLKQSGVQEESQCTDVCRSAERVAIGNARKEAAHAHRTLGNAHRTLGIPRHVRLLHHVSMQGVIMKWFRLVPIVFLFIGVVLLGSPMTPPALAQSSNTLQDNVPGSLLVFPIFDVFGPELHND